MSIDRTKYLSAEEVGRLIAATKARIDFMKGSKI